MTEETTPSQPPNSERSEVPLEEAESPPDSETPRGLSDEQIRRIKARQQRMALANLRPLPDHNPPPPKPSRFPIRIGRVLLATLGGLILIMAGMWAYHPVRVWLASGYWCVEFSPNGDRVIRYGDECKR